MTLNWQFYNNIFSGKLTLIFILSVFFIVFVYILICKLFDCMYSTTVDMNKLWTDSKMVNEIEINKLKMKLSRAGLF